MNTGKQKFIVCIAGETESAWFTDDNQKEPQLFDTIEEAEAELKKHIRDIEIAVEKGDMDGETADTIDDFCIVPVKLFSVEATMTTCCYLDVWAHDEADARYIGKNRDGGDFKPDDDNSGDWEITGAMEI